MSDHVIAVFVSQSGGQHQLSVQLESRGLKVLVAQSSEQLHQFVNTHRIDAVVVQQNLGGFLTGLEILQRLREQLLRPLLVVIGELSEAENLQAAELRIDHVCSWDEGADRISSSISDLLSLARHHGFLIPAGARQLVAESDHVGIMPQLVVQLMRYLQDENAKVTELAKDISSDAAVTAELIKLINSSSFGLKTRITHVESAVKYLGIRRTVSLVFELSFHSMRRSWHDRLPPELMTWFGMRSVVSASVASAFAVRRKSVPPDTVYVLALLQDLGILVFCQAYQDRYRGLLSQAQSVALLQLEKVEKAEYSFSHADVSAALLQHWEFPASMIQLVLEHHHSIENLSQTDRNLRHLMQLGEAVANLRDVPSPQRHARFQNLLSESSVTSAIDAKACIASAIAHSREVTRYFNLAVPEKDAWWDLSQRMQEFVNNGSPKPTAVPPVFRGPGFQRTKPSVVIVIDDEPYIGQIITQYLSGFPLEVKCYESPPEASHLTPDVATILCDVHLQGKSGIEVVRELRATGYTRPIMMISADRTRNTVLSSIEAGIIDYISKPLSKAALLEKFRKHGLLPQTASTPSPARSD